MWRHPLFVAVLLAVTVASTAFAEQPAYRLVENFLQFPPDLKLGAVSGVAINQQGQIAIVHRDRKPIIIFAPNGQFLRTFGDEQLVSAHGLRWNAEGDLWVTDSKNHTVIKYRVDGKPLLILGERGKPGEDETHFNRPTDVAVGRDDAFFVSDGYGNNRVVKFSKDGKFIRSWGAAKGKAPGQFNLPHGLQIDARGLLHVADRENDRIQVFDQDGKFIRSYGGFAPFGMSVAPDQTLYIADGRAHKAYHMTLEGKILAEWGVKGSAPGAFFNLPHGIAADKAGNVYVTEITGMRVQKFARVE